MFLKFASAAMAAILSINAFAAPKEVRIQLQPGVAFNHTTLIAQDLIVDVATKKGESIVVKPIPAANSGVANNMLVSGDIDIVIGGISSFGHLDAARPGEYKLLSGFLTYQGWLVCRSGIKSVKDLKPGDRVAMSSLGTPQQVMLRQIAKNELGDGFALDKNIAVMPNNTATKLLAAKDPALACHCCMAPDQNNLVRSGMTAINRAGTNGIDPVTVVVWAKKSWLDANPRVAESWIEALAQAVKVYEKDRYSATKRWVDYAGLKVDVKQLVADNLENRQVISPSLAKIDVVLNNLKEMNIVKGDRRSYDEIVWRPGIKR